MRLFSVASIIFFATVCLACVDEPVDENACDGVSCSGRGTCAVTGSGAFCVCEPGYGPAGTECLPCGDIPASQDVVVPAVRLVGTFKIDGELPPDSVNDTGDIWLESDQQGRVRLGATHERAFNLRVLPGSYRIVYRFVAGGIQVPLNTHVEIGTLDVYGPTTAHIDVPTAVVTGDLSISGGAPPASQYDDGLIVLASSTSDDEAVIGNTHDQHYQARVVPGSYEVRFRNQTPGDVVAWNGNALIGALEVPDDGGAFDFDLETATVGGDMTLNGQPFPVNEYDDANLYLASADGKDVALLGNTHDGSFAVPVLVGQYQIFYQLETPGAFVPYNQWGYLGDVNIEGDTDSFDIDVHSYLLSGEVTVDGNDPPANEYDDGNVILRNGVDEVFLANTHTPTIFLQVLGGTYDVVVGNETPGNIVPFNDAAAFAELVVDDNKRAFVADVPSGRVSGDMRFNGELAPANQYADGFIVAENSETGDRAVLGNTHSQIFDVPLVRGLYDLYFESQTVGGPAPANQHARVGTLNVDSSSVEHDVNIIVGPAAGSILINGNVPPGDQDDSGLLSARNAEQADSAELASTYEGSYETRLVSGAYDVYYTVEHAGDFAPENLDGRIGCFTVAP